MRKSDIEIGRVYYSKIKGELIPVRVDGVRGVLGVRRGHNGTVALDVYDVSTLEGSRMVFRSAARFHSPVGD